MTTTCGGYCCEKFHFRNNLSPEEVKQAGQKGEFKQVAEMVIYLGESDHDVEGTKSSMLHWYTCKHFDTDTRLCKIYEARPSMCRTYNVNSWNRCGLKSCKLPPPPEPNYGDEVKLKKDIDDVAQSLKSLPKLESPQG